MHYLESGSVEFQNQGIRLAGPCEAIVESEIREG
jgi:hypothetical protein